MKQLLKQLVEFVEKKQRPNFRDRCAHYPSDILSCLRDQVWKWRGEPETNPPDFYALLKMLIGDAVEKHLMDHWFSQLHWSDVHFVGSQIAVGGSDPKWDGFLDGMVAQLEAGHWQKRVLEVKCIFGYGADNFMSSFAPKDSHLVQIGLYLKDLHEKRITNEGILVYVPISDSYVGSLVFVHCRFLAESGEVEAYLAQVSDGKEVEISYKASVTNAIERMRIIDAHLANGTTPQPEFCYKKELTRDNLNHYSDIDLRRAIEGKKVLGDWQVLYSRYKNKQLKEDNVEPGYSSEELAILRKYYLTRHPKSKI